MAESKFTQAQSHTAILQANKLRKEIIALRTKSRQATELNEKNNLTNSANQLATKLKRLQARGNELRATAKTLFQQSLNLFEQGFVEQWGQQIRSRNPILMGASKTLFFAHNTRIRSVHPNMLNKMGTASDVLDESELNDEMSLLIPALAQQNAPQELDISSFQISREHQYIGHIEVKAETKDKADEKSQLVPANTIHKWLLMLSDLDGEPVRNAAIEIVGHMPGHVHGLPTQPRVTQELVPGTYQVEGVKFQMKGWWVMRFNMSVSNNKNDSIVFNLVL